MAYSNRRESGVRCFGGGKTLNQAEFTSDRLVNGFRTAEPCGMYAAVLRDRIIELRGEK